VLAKLFSKINEKETNSLYYPFSYQEELWKNDESNIAKSV